MRITVRAELDNAWVGIDGDLIQKESDLVQPFDVEVSHYHGLEDGEAWQEGSQEDSVYLSALPEGSYRMRLEFVSEHQAAPAAPAVQPQQQPPAAAADHSVHVRLEQGTVHVWPWILTVLALSVIPALVGAYHFWFERRRWEESAFSPFHAQPVKDMGRRQLA